MSHSPSDAERAWHYGMLDTDWVAFPILSAEEKEWSAGVLDTRRSLWRERSLASWHLVGRINLFTVAAFRAVAPKQLKAKGVSERTVRLTGCKLARLTRDGALDAIVRELASDSEEDVYARMEARSYLCEVAGDSADDHFRPILLNDADDQMRLEAAVALAETRTPSAFDLLRTVLEHQDQPLFLRSACAWGVGCHCTEQAAECLVRAFADVAPQIREEALVALVEIGDAAFAPLLRGLAEESSDVSAGAAEALRRIADVPTREIAELAQRSRSTWPVWTLAHLSRSAVAPHIAALQGERPDVHFAVAVLWTFLESWIAEDWTPRATP